MKQLTAVWQQVDHQQIHNDQFDKLHYTGISTISSTIERFSDKNNITNIPENDWVVGTLYSWKIFKTMQIQETVKSIVHCLEKHKNINYNLIF